jgi:hypothetical protein
MSLPRTLLLASSYPRHRAFLRDLADPRAATDRVWRETWWQIEKAPFWRERMGAPGRATPPLASFPVTDYETYREALEASYRRTVSELSGDPIRFWSVSAGTTGPRKLFPITDHYRKQFQRTMPPFLYGLARRYRGLLRAPALYFAGAMPQEESPAGIEVGFISNYNYRNIPGFLRKHYALPVEALADGETFFEWAPLYALGTDLSAIFGVTPAIMVRFFERMVTRLDRYWPILAGQASPPAPLPPIAIGERRLAQLKRALARDPFALKDIWPSLQFVCCWKTSTCGMQIPSLERYTQGRVPLVDGIYSATEGWMNVPAPSGEPGGPLHPGAHVIEFLPEGAAPEARNLLQADELEPGRNYEVVLTTSMGMVRYQLRDLVRCTGRRRRAPIIEFVQKTGSEISLGPACVSEAELGEALVRANVRGAERLIFAPSPEGDHLELCHVGDAGDDDAEAVDRALREISEMYGRYAGDGTLRAIRARRLREGHPAIEREQHAQSKPKMLLREPVRD